MKIKCSIKQIIHPNKRDRYMGNPIWEEDYYLVKAYTGKDRHKKLNSWLDALNISIFFSFIPWLITRKWDVKVHDLLFKECTFNVGDDIEINIEPIIAPAEETGFFKAEKI